LFYRKRFRFFTFSLFRVDGRTPFVFVVDASCLQIR